MNDVPDCRFTSASQSRLHAAVVLALLLGSITTFARANEADQRKIEQSQKQCLARTVIGQFGNVIFRHQFPDRSIGKEIDYNATPPGSAELRTKFGDDYFQRVTVVDLDKANIPSTPVLVPESCGDDVLKNLADLPDVEQLRIKSDRITDAGLKHLAGLMRLEWVTLDAPQLTDSGLRSLKRLRHLKQIDLVHTQVTFEGIDWLREALPGALIIYQPGDGAGMAFPPR